MTSTTLTSILSPIIDLVREAGARLAAEFARPDGPRFSDTDTAPIDTEIERFLRDGLTKLLPARFVGEEEGAHASEANAFCWVVDPHDGTRAFLEGKRGSAVSVGLLRDGEPVLGVVYAPLSPDRGPDLIAWAEGGPILRNGRPVDSNLRNRALTAADVVFLNHGASQRPVWNGTACAPARFAPLPSIAYRLARVAVGDGIATVTLRPVNAHDIAAGHALLRAAGGVLMAEDGVPVTYDELGASRPFACFGGAPLAVETLLKRTWRGSTEARRKPLVTLTWPRHAENPRFDRALGCMLGMVIGDSLGSQVEFQNAARIRAAYPHGVTELADSPVWGTMAGQPTDDSELGLTLARSLVRCGGYDPDDVAGAYGDWYASDPFDCGITTRAAFAAATSAAAAHSNADPESQGNGSLMRIAPIGVWAADPDEAARLADADSTLSHPHPACCTACAAFAAAISVALDGGSRADMIATARHVARGYKPLAQVIDAAAAGRRPADYQTKMGWVLIAMQNAFYHLAAGTPFEAALVQTVSQGGDTDTNAAIAGALLGAADGRASMPVRWIMPVLTCRPHPGLHAARPRPEAYWPDDLLDLTEALLLKRGYDRDRLS